MLTVKKIVVYKSLGGTSLISCSSHHSYLYYNRCLYTFILTLPGFEFAILETYSFVLPDKESEAQKNVMLATISGQSCTQHGARRLNKVFVQILTEHL